MFSVRRIAVDEELASARKGRRGEEERDVSVRFERSERKKARSELTSSLSVLQTAGLSVKIQSAPQLSATAISASSFTVHTPTSFPSARHFLKNAWPAEVMSSGNATLNPETWGKKCDSASERVGVMLCRVRPGRSVCAGMMKAGCLHNRQGKGVRRVQRDESETHQRPRMSLGARSVSQLGNFLMNQERKREGALSGQRRLLNNTFFLLSPSRSACTSNPQPTHLICSPISLNNRSGSFVGFTSICRTTKNVSELEILAEEGGERRTLKRIVLLSSFMSNSNSSSNNGMGWIGDCLVRTFLRAFTKTNRSVKGEGEGERGHDATHSICPFHARSAIFPVPSVVRSSETS